MAKLGSGKFENVDQMMTTLLSVMLFAVVTAVTDTEFDIIVDTSKPVSIVDPREASITWDIYALKPVPMKAHSPLDLTNEALIKLVSQLHPFVLRVGGTGGENVQFSGDPATYVAIPNSVVKNLRPGGGGTKPGNISAHDWDTVGTFAKSVGADLVLGLNQLVRHYPEGGASGGCDNHSSCVWDTTNARAWLEHNKQANYTVYGYELVGCAYEQIFV
jgi:hypothetical protein